MDKKLFFLEQTDTDKNIEKKFKKYILEIDDAIEAHGFKATSYIDYAEGHILELQDSIKEHYKEHGSSPLFKNLLESTLKDTTTNIVKYAFEEESKRNNEYNQEILKEKASKLHEDFMFLNQRLLNSFKN